MLDLKLELKNYTQIEVPKNFNYDEIKELSDIVDILSKSSNQTNDLCKGV